MVGRGESVAQEALIVPRPVIVLVCAIEIYEVYKVIRRDISFGAPLVAGDADFEGLADAVVVR